MDLLGILVVLAIAGSVAGLVFLFTPLLTKRYTNFQKKQMQEVEFALEELFLPIPKEKLGLLYVGFMVGTGIVVYFLTQNPFLSVLGILFGSIVPMIIVRIMEEQRRMKFLDQLVDTLGLLSSSLKAGLTLPQAFEVIVEEMPSPTREEFALILQQMKMGIPLEEALARLRRRIRNDDVDIVVISVLVARDTGGNVTEVFSNLAKMIREKKKLTRRVQVLTVQARLQGLLISAMPFFFVPFALSQNPHHFDIFFRDRVGQILLFYAVTSEVLGLFFLRRLSKIEV